MGLAQNADSNPAIGWPAGPNPQLVLFEAVPEPAEPRADPHPIFIVSLHIDYLVERVAETGAATPPALTLIGMGSCRVPVHGEWIVRLTATHPGGSGEVVGVTWRRARAIDPTGCAPGWWSFGVVGADVDYRSSDQIQPVPVGGGRAVGVLGVDGSTLLVGETSALGAPGRRWVADLAADPLAVTAWGEGDVDALDRIEASDEAARIRIAARAEQDRADRPGAFARDGAILAGVGALVGVGLGAVRGRSLIHTALSGAVGLPLAAYAVVSELGWALLGLLALAMAIPNSANPHPDPYHRSQLLAAVAGVVGSAVLLAGVLGAAVIPRRSWLGPAAVGLALVASAAHHLVWWSIAAYHGFDDWAGPVSMPVAAGGAVAVGLGLQLALLATAPRTR